MPDYLGSATQPRITSLPAREPSPSISVDFDGWILPKAGVAFVWVLESEVVRRRGERDISQPQSPVNTGLAGNRL